MGLILLKKTGFLRSKNISFHWGLIGKHFGLIQCPMPAGGTKHLGESSRIQDQANFLQ